MANVFVNKSGNDANSGASRALAKLTIQAAHDVAVSGVDTIKIGSGEYREAIVSTKALTVEADVDSPMVPSGFVVIDGENVRSIGWNQSNNSALTIRGLTFRRHTIADVDRTPGAIGTPFVADRCTFLDGPRGFRTRGGGALTLNRCLFRNKTTSGIEPLDSDGQHPLLISISQCVFDSCVTGVLFGSFAPASGSTGIFNNVFLGCARDISFAGLSAASIASLFLDYNSHFGWTTAIGRLASTDYTTLAAWRTATGKETNSLDVDPLLLDPAKGLFLSRRDSPLRRRGRSGETIGLGTGEGISNNRNAALWTGGVFTGTTITGGNVVQSTAGTNGTYETDVLDLGALSVVTGFPISALVTYATQVIDHSIADSAPNRPTIEYRTSASAFLKTDASPSYVAIERDSFLTSLVSGRYWQFRAVLRSDGVAA